MMQFGYVLCDPKRSKILILTKTNEVKFISLKNKENINKAFCLRDQTSIKSLYLKLKENNIVNELDIVNIQELYRSNS
tara:strand:- start:580 stop:813 length:234 start_codon:yes stop_codon:yes gene_type:complete